MNNACKLIERGLSMGQGSQRQKSGVKAAGEAPGLLDFLQEVYALRDVHTFGYGLVHALSSIFSCDIYSYNEVNPESQKLSFIGTPEIITGDDLCIFEKFMHQHPLVSFYKRTGDGRALKVSDFLSKREFHRLELYNEYFRKYKIEQQLAVVLPALPPLVVGVVLSRCGPDFNEKERQLLELLRPHLLVAYKNAEVFTSLRESLESSGKAAFMEINAGRVTEMTGQAGRWLKKYFGNLRSGERLPEELDGWVKREEKTRGRTRGVPCPHQSLTVKRETGKLTVRLLRSEGRSTLIMEEKRVSAPDGLQAFGLTGKERQILEWVSFGKTNKEIGIIEGISHLTVKKHLEHIYEKLGVETRTAAAGLLNNLLDTSRSDKALR
jgi:DNA-binding CsgD family transcriptional regulator